jgi:hypothetical protein
MVFHVSHGLPANSTVAADGGVEVGYEARALFSSPAIPPHIH